MFPDYLDGARVLEYTDLGHYGFITDYDENNVPVEKEICYLAICQYSGDDAVYLFSCDTDCAVIADFSDDYKWLKAGHPDSVWHEKPVALLCSAFRRKMLGGTCYFEFQRGQYYGKHWLERSVFLHADLFDKLNLCEVFSQALPKFDYYGVTEVTPAQYEKLKALALHRGGQAAALIRELDPWVEDCFLTETIFTICGI